MFDHIRHASLPIAKHALLRCSEVSVARKARAASETDASETPVFPNPRTPGTTPPLLVIPRRGSARPALAQSSMGFSRGGRSKRRIAGVGGRSRKPKRADSPAMLGPPYSRPGDLIQYRHTDKSDDLTAPTTRSARPAIDPCCVTQLRPMTADTSVSICVGAM